MSYTIKKVATISGVSIRTLHYYDQINLLKPAYYKANKHRYYNELELLQLQQILFFKELGFNLKKIKSIIQGNEFNHIKALHSHCNKILDKINHFKTLLKTLDNTMNHLRGNIRLEFDQLYNGLNNRRQCEQEVIAQLGDSLIPFIQKVNTITKDMPKALIDKIKIKEDKLLLKIVACLNKSMPINSTTVQQLIKQHFNLRWKIYSPSKEEYININALSFKNDAVKQVFEA